MDALLLFGGAFGLLHLMTDKKTPRPNMGHLENGNRMKNGNGIKNGNGGVPNGEMHSSHNDQYASVEGLQGRQPFQSCVEQQGAWLSSNLLPKDTSNVTDDWTVSTPGNLEDKNFLEAGYHFGIDTIGSSHKNANLQLRSEPIIPRQKISPFLNSSIIPDDHRRRFEVDEF